MTEQSAARILVIDNYDSFVYTIVGYLQQMGAKTTVVRNDEVPADETGAVDLTLDADRPGEAASGDEPMSRVTGTGCLHTAIAAACAAVEDDPYVAAHAAATWLSVAGQRAGKATRRPGTFRIALLDAIDEVKDEA